MNKDFLKNYLISKLFAIDAITIENTIINEETNEIKQKLKFNSNIIVNYPELFIYFLKFLTSYSLLHKLELVNVCGINQYSSSFSHFLSYYHNVKNVNYLLLKKNNDLICNENINDNSLLKEPISLFCDVIKNKETLKEVIDIIQKTYYKPNIYVLFDKDVTSKESLHKISEYLDGNEESSSQEITIHPIFKESDFNDYLNPDIETNIFSNRLANNMYHMAITKRSNIIFSCDLTNIDEICNAIHRLGSHIIGVKLNSEKIYNFHKEPKERLKYLKKIYNLFLIDDRRIYSEYDNSFITFKNKPNQLLDWADAITVQSNCIDNLLINYSEIINNEYLNLILINKNNNNNLFNNYFNDNTLKHLDNQYVTGYISKKDINNDNNLHISMTEEYSNIDSYKENNKLFWCVGDNILHVDNLEKMTKKIQSYKKIGFEYFIKY